jgi:hypothetical protein
LPKCFDFLCGQQSRPELQEDLSFSPPNFTTIQADSIQQLKQFHNFYPSRVDSRQSF